MQVQESLRLFIIKALQIDLVWRARNGLAHPPPSPFTRLCLLFQLTPHQSQGQARMEDFIRKACVKSDHGQGTMEQFNAGSEITSVAVDVWNLGRAASREYPSWRLSQALDTSVVIGLQKCLSNLLKTQGKASSDLCAGGRSSPWKLLRPKDVSLPPIIGNGCFC